MTAAQSISNRRRVLVYCVGGILAAAAGSGSFSIVYGWLHAGTVWGSAAGFVGGASTNWFLTRRWAWNDRRSGDRRREITTYVIISLTLFLTSAVATHYADRGAGHLTSDHLLKTVLVAGAYVSVSGFFFVAKFLLYYYVVFTGRREAPVPAPAQQGATASSPH
ncbi:MAG: GtrA family protein [Acidimicrobiaceae bacterium]|nr:GtrA family protein [Acidimicrobiaceae bacterium]